jgi:IclR family acetate operon transcriptional repressor
VARSFEVLEALAARGGFGSLSAVARDCGLAPGTVHRLLASLVDLGYARRDVERRYALGPRLIALGEIAGGQLGRWAQPHLEDVAARTGETTNLAVLDRDHAVYVAQAASKHDMRIFTEVGRHVLPHTTAVGKVLLADLSVAQVREIIARTGLRARTSRTITSIRALLRQLEQVRSSGFAIDDGEREVGIRCFAVPVRGWVRAAMSVSGPEGRLNADAWKQIVPVLNAAAQAMERSLATTR